MDKRMFMAACTLGVLTLTACGGGNGGGGSENGEVTLKLVAADYGDKASNSSTAYWNDVAQRFTAANPKIKVDVQPASPGAVSRTRSDSIRRRKASITLPRCRGRPVRPCRRPAPWVRRPPRDR